LVVRLRSQASSSFGVRGRRRDDNSIGGVDDIIADLEQGLAG